MGDLARRSGARWDRRALPIGVLAAIAVLVVVTPLASAAPVWVKTAPFHNASWSAASTKDATGCATGTNEKTHWSKTTGVGVLFVKAHAHTCRGQNPVYASTSTVSSTLQIVLPLRQSSSTTGANVSWAITGSFASSAGVVGPLTCAPTRSNVSYDLGYTWENYSSIAFSCFAVASVEIGGTTLLDDRTTGVETGANNSWAGVENISGVQNYSFADRYSYSNASYWSYNSTSSWTLNHTYGTRGVLSGHWSPTWYLNGSFSATDRYVLVTSVSLTVSGNSFGYVRSYAGGSGDLMNGANRADLTSVDVW